MSDMARHLAMALDPVRFMTAAGYPPDAWQEAFLRSQAPRRILVASRQIGKSLSVAALAVHRAMYSPGSLVLLIAPTMRQSQELYLKVLTFLKEGAKVYPEAENASRVELPNGSRIVTLSGNAESVRGYSAPRLIVLDEAAWLSDEMLNAVTPMLPEGGQLIALSTPNGQQGWFYRLWSNGSDTWQRTLITADMVPHRVTAEKLRGERETKPEWQVEQEFFGAFVATEGSLISEALVSKMVDPTIQPLFPGGQLRVA